MVLTRTICLCLASLTLVEVITAKSVQLDNFNPADFIVDKNEKPSSGGDSNSGSGSGSNSIYSDGFSNPLTSLFGGYPKEDNSNQHASNPPSNSYPPSNSQPPSNSYPSRPTPSPSYPTIPTTYTSYPSDGSIPTTYPFGGYPQPTPHPMMPQMTSVPTSTAPTQLGFNDLAQIKGYHDAIGTKCRFYDETAYTNENDCVQNGASRGCVWKDQELQVGDSVRNGFCICKRGSRECQAEESCYWYEDMQDSERSLCMSSAERFYKLLKVLLARRGKRDFAIRIESKTAPTRGILPYGPHGPAIYGFGSSYYAGGQGQVASGFGGSGGAGNPWDTQGYAGGFGGSGGAGNPWDTQAGGYAGGFGGSGGAGNPWDTQTGGYAGGFGGSGGAGNPWDTQTGGYAGGFGGSGGAGNPWDTQTGGYAGGSGGAGNPWDTQTGGYAGGSGGAGNPWDTQTGGYAGGSGGAGNPWDTQTGGYGGGAGGHAGQWEDQSGGHSHPDQWQPQGQWPTQGQWQPQGQWPTPGQWQQTSTGGHHDQWQSGQQQGHYPPPGAWPTQPPVSYPPIAYGPPQFGSQGPQTSALYGGQWPSPPVCH